MFTCQRCGFETDHKHVIIRHLKRKTVCKPVKEDIDRVQQLQELSKEEKVKQFACERCGKTFTHASSLSRHHKACLTTNKELKDEVETLKQTIQTMQQKLEGLQL
jgi:predicted RNA-binding Zn-ribbon protein involved in translation (DUF1610 family)